MDENKGCWHQLLPAAGWTVHWVCRVCVCVCLISAWVLRCHSREAHGKQHASLMTIGSAPLWRATYRLRCVTGVLCAAV